MKEDGKYTAKLFHETFSGDFGSGEPVESTFVQVGRKRRRRGKRKGQRRRAAAVIQEPIVELAS